MNIYLWRKKHFIMVSVTIVLGFFIDLWKVQKITTKYGIVTILGLYKWLQGQKKGIFWWHEKGASKVKFFFLL